jgi:hypothetical protein
MSEDELKYIRWVHRYCVLVVFVVMIGIFVFVYHEISQARSDKSYAICDANMTERPGIDGLWFSTGYYCVWAAGHNIDEINNTDAHERCHVLVEAMPEHFCNCNCSK